MVLRLLHCTFHTYISFHGAGVGELGYMTIAPPLFRTDNFQLQLLCRVWRLTDVEALDRFRLWGQKREYSLIKIKWHLTQYNNFIAKSKGHKDCAMVPSLFTHAFSWSSVSFFVVFLSLLQWHSVRGVWHMKQICLGAIFSSVVFCCGTSNKVFFYMLFLQTGAQNPLESKEQWVKA